MIIGGEWEEPPPTTYNNISVERLTFVSRFFITQNQERM